MNMIIILWVFPVSETWLGSNIGDDSVYVDGYSFVRLDRETRAGGVGIYVRDNFSYRVIMSESRDFIEYVWIVVEILGQSLVVGCVYRPPSSDEDSFFKSLEESVTDVFDSFENIICFGDFNINLYNSTSSRTRKLLNLMNTFDFNQPISELTRITNCSDTLIDLLFYNGENVINCGSRDYSASDGSTNC